jgi:hypothetical protein
MILPYNKPALIIYGIKEVYRSISIKHKMSCYLSYLERMSLKIISSRFFAKSLYYSVT